MSVKNMISRGIILPILTIVPLQTAIGESQFPADQPERVSQHTADSMKYAPDNSGVNVRDRNRGAVTADQQGMNVKDTELVGKIRRELMREDSLSTYAQNVKIVANNGKVILKGPVNSMAERDLIERKSVQIAGAGNVTNELEVVRR